LAIGRAPDVSVIVPVTPASNVTVSPAGVSMIAWRREPAPLSAVFVTTAAGAGATTTSAAASAAMTAATVRGSALGGSGRSTGSLLDPAYRPTLPPWRPARQPG
jgi:hypothetical protein